MHEMLVVVGTAPEHEMRKVKRLTAYSSPFPGMLKVYPISSLKDVPDGYSLGFVVGRRTEPGGTCVVHVQWIHDESRSGKLSIQTGDSYEAVSAHEEKIENPLSGGRVLLEALQNDGKTMAFAAVYRRV